VILSRPKLLSIEKNSGEREASRSLKMLLTALFYHKIELFSQKGGAEGFDCIEFGLDTFL
jgi:hypothetical protein